MYRNIEKKSIKANIVVVDSGLEYCYQKAKNIKGGICFQQNNDGQIIENKSYNDIFGHGTAIFHIINDNCNDATFYFIKIFDDTPECNQDLLIHSLEYIYENISCDFILLSSGAVFLKDVKKFNDITKKLYDNNRSIIISAFNNEGALSYPAAGEFVIGVDSSPNINQKESHYIINGSPINIFCSQRSYRVTWLNGKKLIQKGNSYSAAYFVSKLFHAFCQTKSKNKEVLLQHIRNKSNELSFEQPCLKQILSPSFLSKKSKLRAIAFPFSKEIRALAANEDLLCVNIINYYDVRQSGKTNLKVCDVLGYSDNTKIIKSIDSIELEDDYDLIICGHLDLINQITKCDWNKKLKEIAYRKQKIIYFFDYDPDRTSDNIYSPPFIQKYNGCTFGKMWQINAPVLGVFGTSSIQGKFSLQLKLRRAFLNDGYSISQVSTEPTGALFGMDFVCPIGYGSSIKLSGNDAAKFYNQIIHECDKFNPDLILIGGQSSTLPHNYYNEQYLTFSQTEFLFGTIPDAVVLVINEFDDISYIKRTIKFIESSIQSKVITCVISPVKTVTFCDNFAFNHSNLSEKLEVPVFDYHTQFNLIYQSIISYFGGAE